MRPSSSSIARRSLKAVFNGMVTETIRVFQMLAAHSRCWYRRRSEIVFFDVQVTSLVMLKLPCSSNSTFPFFQLIRVAPSVKTPVKPPSQSKAITSEWALRTPLHLSPFSFTKVRLVPGWNSAGNLVKTAKVLPIPEPYNLVFPSSLAFAHLA